MPNANYAPRIALTPSFFMTSNWINESRHGKATKDADAFSQITQDAVQSLTPNRKQSVGVKYVIVFTQEQVDRVIELAPFRITATKIDYYFVLKRGE